LIGFNENLDNLEKSHNDSQEEPVAVSLQVIIDLVKELWETYSGNKKWEKDTKKDVAV